MAEFLSSPSIRLEYGGQDTVLKMQEMGSHLLQKGPSVRGPVG